VLRKQGLLTTLGRNKPFIKINLLLYDLLVDFGCIGKGKVTVLTSLLQG